MTIKRIFEVGGVDISTGREIQVAIRVHDAGTNLHIIDGDTLINIPKTMALDLIEAVSLLLE